VSTSRHYKSNLRDLYFNLFEFLQIGSRTLGHEPFSGMDEATAKAALSGLEEFASNELASSFADADRVGLTLDSAGNVHLPASLNRSLAAYYDNGWDRLSLPERLGGSQAPPSVSWAAFELTAGSNAALAFYVFGPFVGRVIDWLGTDAQRARFVQPLIDGRWGGSMVLTEPDAGSDVGAGRAKARKVEGDLYEIEGVKRFITNGDFDFAANVVHLVLARPEGAPAGTKGLSMFIVPKYWVEADGKLGERNGAVCTNIEHKMGIKASATCEMTFGDQRPARGFLVGNVHDGIRQMFHMIEHARMAVGVKSMATLSTAYLNALEYAKERVQGSDLLNASDKSAPKVRIIEHPDVRRMLMSQKAHAEGMRALVLYAASIQDRIELAGGHGAAKNEGLDRLNDLLLPLIKGYCSEKVYELLAVSLQCFGGSGYCQDYPIEQYIRDQKIDSLYEGTTHIQALDLFFRKIARDGGETLRGLLGTIKETLTQEEGGAELAPERKRLAAAVGEVEAIFGAMMQKIGESPYHVGLQGNRILMALAELVIGWLLVRQSALARSKISSASASDRDFYAGKVAAARFFAENVLPGIGLTRRLIEAGTLELMQLSEAAF
jgi:alkylation response protein AidB-like acyl-CoA dehydrogenase